MARAAVWFAVALVLVVLNGVHIAAAGPTPATMPADAQSIAKQLAAAVPGEPTASCDAGSVTEGSPYSMFNGVGLAAARADLGILSTPPPLQVMCALPYTNGKPGGDCTGKHFLQFQTVGALPGAKVTAELLALDASGNVLKTFAVKNGDTAQLASRLLPRDWKMVAGSNKDFTVFAPVPMLHVTVEDQGQKAEAFCSNIPWVDVIQPNGGVVSESAGNETKVLAAIPLTNPAALHLMVDGVDLLAPGVIPGLPATLTACSAAFPCGGTATVNGSPVGVSGLIVDVASSISSMSSNTLRATLTDLSCGGHFVRVSSSKLPGSLKNPTAEQCDVDDLTDKAGLSVFALSITNPVPNSINNLIPTAVAGEACSGTEITDVNINGKTLPVAGPAQTHVVGNGETTGDVWKVVINTTLNATDVVNDSLTGGPSALGTFDPGTNRLAASAREIQGNRTYETFIFATGLTAPIGKVAGLEIVGDPNTNVFQKAAVQAAVNDQLKRAVEESVPVALAETETELNNAFIVGLSAEGTQTLFTKLCTTPIPFEGDMLTPGQIFQRTVKRTIEAIALPSISVPVPCAPDPDVHLSITNVTVGSSMTCTTNFQNGLFSVRMDLPNIHVDAHGHGHAQDDIPVVGGCLAGVTIDGGATADITGIHLDFNVTDDNLLHDTFSASNFDAGTTVTAKGNVDVSFCGASVFCEIAADALNFLSFGLIPDLLHIDFEFSHSLDFKDAVGANEPDPVKLKQIKVDEQVVANFDQKMSGVVSEVHITPQGISAGLKGKFATMVVDAGIPGNAGITLTPAPVPTMAQMKSQGAQDALIGLSDDTINMMFASLTAAGKLKTGDAQGCFNTGAKVGSLLPAGDAGCETLSIGGDNVATAIARGYCHAIKGHACGGLAYNTPAGLDGFLTAKEQGVCYGATGVSCESIPGAFDFVKWVSCTATPNFNLHADQNLIFCAKGDVPPRMLFPNDGLPGSSVPTALRLNDLTVALMIDRSGPPTETTGPNGLIDAPLGTLPSCFSKTASNKSDCNVFAACLDLGLNFNMKNITCPLNPAIPGDKAKHGFKAEFSSIQIMHRDLGVVCSGVTAPTGDTAVIGAASDDTITIPLGQNAGTLSPDICGAGLDLGGFVSCTSPAILAVEADGSPAMKDYLGLTCTIQ